MSILVQISVIQAQNVSVFRQNNCPNTQSYQMTSLLEEIDARIVFFFSSIEWLRICAFAIELLSRHT